MKRLNSLILIVSLLCVIPLAVTAQTLVNGGFEIWSNGPSQAPDGWTTSSAITATQESSTVLSGSYSCSLYWDSVSTQRFQQLVTGITAGNSYRFRCWANDNDTGGRARINFRWEESDGTYIGITRFSADICRPFFDAIQSLLDEGCVNVFFNVAVEKLIADGIPVSCTSTAGLPWAEIDDEADLEFAQKHTCPSLVSSFKPA